MKVGFLSEFQRVKERDVRPAQIDGSRVND